MDSTSSSKTTHGTIAGNSTAIDTLLQDHTQIKALLDRLNNAQGQNEQAQVLEQLKELLTIHNATEENFVYAALAKVAGKKHESEHLYHETAEADMLVFELDTCLKTNDITGFSRNAKKLRDAVFEHIEDEERKAFPQLADTAQPEQTEMLDRSVSKFRSSLHFHKG